MRRSSRLDRRPNDSHPSRRLHLRRLRVDPLEDRRLLDGATLFVDVDAVGAATGASWTDAFTDLQPALAAASTLNADVDPANDIAAIWLAAGAYKPTERLDADDPRTATFSLIPNVDLVGGFAGSETSIAQRPFVDGRPANETILSGDIGTGGYLSGSAFTVVYASLSSPDESTLDGVTITGGYAYDYIDSSTSNHVAYGGGIYIESGTLAVLNSTFHGNEARRGGAVFNDGGSLTVINSTLNGNAALEDGGAICNYSGSTLAVTNSVFSGNTVREYGGAIYNVYATLTVTNSTFSGNEARGGYQGRGGSGGIRNYNGTVLLTNSIVAGNLGIRWPDVSGTYTNQSSLVGVDPGFVRLPSDGGDGWMDNGATDYVDESANNDYGDLRLKPSSIAIDAGDASLLPADAFDRDADGDTSEPVPFDSLGLPRVAGGAVDLGAFEFQGTIGNRETPSTVVTTTADVVNWLDETISLREAVIYATLGGLATPVTFDNSQEDGVVSLGGATLRLDADVRIDASSIGGITIDAEGLCRVVEVTGGASVELVALNLVRGVERDGGGILVDHAALTLLNATLVGNTVEGFRGNGGGVNVDEGALTVINSTIVGNSAENDGGGIYASDSASLILANSIVAGNEAADSVQVGGSYTNRSSLIGIDPWFVRDPSPGDDGRWGAADDDLGDLRLRPTSIAIDAGDDALLPPDAFDVDRDTDTSEPIPVDLRGAARVAGAAVDLGAFEFHGDPTATEPRSTVVTTAADLIDWDDGVVSLREAIVYATLGGLATPITFDASLAEGTIMLSGSQLWLDADVRIDATAVGGITIDAGGASRLAIVLGEAAVELVAVTVTGGLTEDGGGGVYMQNGSLTIANSMVSGNAARSGGGIYSTDGTLLVLNSVFSGNTAIYSGGALYGGNASTTVSNSTIHGNYAGRNGGGIDVGFGGTMAVVNSTLIGNVARDYGGGVYGWSVVTVVNSTLSGNSAGDAGGGILGAADTFTVANSIVAGNTAPNAADVRGAYVNRSSLIGVDPAFVRPPDDGGDGWIDDPETEQIDESANNDYGDLRLTSSSIAVDAGDASLLPADTFDADQDGDTSEPLPLDGNGNPRIAGGRLDPGAFEFLGTPESTELPSTIVTTAADVVDWFDGAISLREAIVYATFGGLATPVTFDASLAGETFLLGGTALRIDGDAVVDATDVGRMTIGAGGASGVFVVSGGGSVQLTSLTLVGGAADYGGAIYNDHSTLTLTDSRLEGNSATTRGGGIYSTEGALTLVDSALVGNTATGRFGGGGVYVFEGELIVSNSTFDGNAVVASNGSGGGVRLHDTTAAITDSTFTENSATSSGGAIYSERTTLVVNGSTISWNSTPTDSGRGGGIYSKRGTLSLIDSGIHDNSSYYGGGIYSESSTLAVANSVLSGNEGRYGGAIHISDSTMDLANSALTRNEGTYGGGIYVSDGLLEVARSTFTGNGASGGGIRIEDGVLVVTNSVFAGNSAGSRGGGIYNRSGTCDVANSTFSGNTTRWSSSRGGGIYNEFGVLTLDNTVVAGNTASYASDVWGEYTERSSLIGVDPGFVRNPSLGADGEWGTEDDDYGDLRLVAGSLAIDAGDNTLAVDANAHPLATDLAGSPRRLDGDDDGWATVDVGAYEFLPPIVGAYLYYRDSAHDDGSGDAAIAVDKRPLAPGRTATAENYSSCDAGINGLMIDVNKPDDGRVFSAADFVFRVGNGGDPNQWPQAPAPIAIHTRPGAGTAGSVRVQIDWPSGAICNTWLQVTVRANGNTGLSDHHVFYFGNAVAETGNDPSNALVTAADLVAIRNHTRGDANRAEIDDPHDVNRDRVVDAIDQILARNFATGPFNALRLIAPPEVVAAPPEGEGETPGTSGLTSTPTRAWAWHPVLGGSWWDRGLER